MKKALFALSLLVVAPTIKASELSLANSVNTTTAAVTAASAASVVSQGALPASVVPSQGILATSCQTVSNGVVFVKNGVSCVYNKVTGTVERFTPNMVLNARDSVRQLISSYPLTAVALTAFVAVKASEFFSGSSDASADEDDSF